MIRLEHERRTRGWSQRTVADFVGLRNQSTVSRWEQRNRKPSRPHGERLATLFGLPLAALLSETTNAAGISADGVEVHPRSARNEGNFGEV
jgi:transcriptional regulator with XRE-family HTH domain